MIPLTLGDHVLSLTLMKGERILSSTREYRRNSSYRNYVQYFTRLQLEKTVRVKSL